MPLQAKKTHSHVKGQMGLDEKAHFSLWDIIYYSVLGFIIIMYLFFIQNVVVSGESMYPTLGNNDILMVSRSNEHIDQSDIVVFQLDGTDSPWIKRVIGVPGDTIDVIDNDVYRNGTLLTEPYTNGAGQNDFAPISVTLEDDMYWVMGDNRDFSSDSRLVGPVHIDDIRAELLLRYAPFKSF